MADHLSCIRSIERAAPVLFPTCKPVRFSRYIPLHKAAVMMQILPNVLLSRARRSKTLNGFRLPDGRVFFHPEQVWARARAKGQRLQNEFLMKFIESSKLAPKEATGLSLLNDSDS